MFMNAELLNETDRLKKFAYRLTRNMADAEDLLQSTLLRAIEKKHMFKTNSNLFSWVSRIMYNMFVSAYRRKTKFETQYDPESYIERESVQATQEMEMEFRDVNAAMDKLSSAHKQVLVYVCVKDMSYEQVSSLLDIPVGTVRSRLSRARKNLQDILDEPVANSNVRENIARAA